MLSLHGQVIHRQILFKRKPCSPTPQGFPRDSYLNLVFTFNTPPEDCWPPKLTSESTQQGKATSPPDSEQSLVTAGTAFSSRQVTSGSKYLSGLLSALLLYTLQPVFYTSTTQSGGHSFYRTGTGITCAVAAPSSQTLSQGPLSSLFVTARQPSALAERDAVTKSFLAVQ